MNPRRIVWDKEGAHHRFLQLNPTDNDFKLVNASLISAAKSPEPIGERLELPTQSAPEPPAWVVFIPQWRIIYELTDDKVNVLKVDDKSPIPPEKRA
jgi:hypothetical protein